MKRTIYAILAVLALVSAIVFADNTKTGTQAGTALSTKSADNVLDGYRAGYQQVTGKGNTLIGAMAGYSGYDYRGAVKLGYMAGYSDTSSYKLFINTGYYPAYGIFGDFSTGYFGVNKTSPTAALDVTGNAVFSGTLTTGSAGHMLGFYSTKNGTASSTAFGLNGYEGTGMFFPTSNITAFSIGGISKFTVDSVGVAAGLARLDTASVGTHITSTSIKYALPLAEFATIVTDTLVLSGVAYDTTQASTDIEQYWSLQSGLSERAKTYIYGQTFINPVILSPDSLKLKTWCNSNSSTSQIMIVVKDKDGISASSGWITATLDSTWENLAIPVTGQFARNTWYSCYVYLKTVAGSIWLFSAPIFE